MKATWEQSAYSSKQKRLDAIQIKIRRAKTEANHPSYADGTINTTVMNHKAWVTAAAKKDYTQLILEVTEKTKKYQQIELDLRAKLHGK